MNDITSVGIIGLGSFGKFAASLIPRNKGIRILGVDIHDVETEAYIEKTTIEAVANADVVIMAVPLDAYEAVLQSIKHIIKPETLLIDVCSVKVKPEAMITEILPGHSNLLLTHPLFGPLTVGRKLIVTNCSGTRAQVVLDFCQRSLSMELHRMTSEEHDKTMAEVHVLSFFIARGLSDMGLSNQPVATPTYQKLMELVDIDRAHSEELFLTVQNGNPFADEIRQRVVKSFTSLEDELSHGKHLSAV